VDNDLTPWQKYKQNLGEVRPWDLLNPNSEWASEEEADKRYSICQECPELIQLTKTCKKCGCFMAAKTKLQRASCPINKW
jgi:ribosomal protein S27AE